MPQPPFSDGDLLGFAQLQWLEQAGEAAEGGGGEDVASLDVLMEWLVEAEGLPVGQG
jgi:hypothetical protein